MPPHGIFLIYPRKARLRFRSRHCIVDDNKISDNLQAKGKRIFFICSFTPHRLSFSFPSAYKFSRFCLQYELTPHPSFLSGSTRPDDAVFFLGKAPNDILGKDAACGCSAGPAVKAREPFRKGRQPLHLFHGCSKIRIKGRSRFGLDP